MSNLAGVVEAAGLLDRLKETVAECVAREEKLLRDTRLRQNAEQQRHAAASEEAAARLAGAQSSADAVFHAAKARLQARDADRKTRIARARKNGLKQRLDAVADKEGRRKYELQRGMMQRDRDREAGLAAALQSMEAFKAALAGRLETLETLEISTRAAFRSYGAFQRLLDEPEAAREVLSQDDEMVLDAALERLLSTAATQLDQYKKPFLPRLFRTLPPAIFGVAIVAAHAGAVPALRHYGFPGAGPVPAAVSATIALAAMAGLYMASKRGAAAAAQTLTRTLHEARRTHDACFAACDARYARELARIEQEYQDTTRRTEHEWDQARDLAARERDAWPAILDAKEAWAAEHNERLSLAQFEAHERVYNDTLARVRSEHAAAQAALDSARDMSLARIENSRHTEWQAIASDWRERVQPVAAALEEARAAASSQFPEWSAELCESWTAPEHFASAALLGRIHVDVAAMAGGLPKDPRLALPCPPVFSLPALLTYPNQGSVLLETAKTGRDEALASLNNLMLRLLTVAPPGRLQFTVIDPVGLGQSFAGVMHLADYEESLINSRIWTQASQIEQRLGDLSEHMEKVIQMYLRNEYASIAEYNEKAGRIAEKYHFLVVADFPAQFTDVAARRLLNIAASGARCGVFTLIHWDRRQPAPPDLLPDALRKSSVWATARGRDFVLANPSLPGASLLLEAPPAPELATALVHLIGRASKDSNRVEVPFEQVAPTEAQIWTGDTRNELTVAVGRTGATKLQYLALGKGTCQHALIAGKTGSGKSTLFHVLITNLALWCPPSEVEFYLVDFKKGVEFKCYATHRLPHARVVAIESDREFGLSVLQRLDDELKRRGDLFRKLGVQDLPGYKRAGGSEPIPRTLLLIDEFQEFFVEDDAVAQGASVLLDRIVRQGRAFGIHAVLGSQTLGGAYTLARATLGQMAVRIALQCNEADAFLIMDENNPAPRLLSRPGEGIYNDAAGALEGNSPFQVVWLPDDVRDGCLARVRARADSEPALFADPVVFEGNAPADIRENALLRALLAAPPSVAPAAPRAWMGAPNSIKGPTEAVFHKQSGNNLLLVGQREESALAILSMSLLALAAQHPAGMARFIVFDASPPDSPARLFLERVVRAIPHEVLMPRPGDTSEALESAIAQLKTASDEEALSGQPALFIVVNGLQRLKKLHFQEELAYSMDESAATNPAVRMQQLIAEGPRAGIHLLVSCDTGGNVTRCLGRKAVGEFELRVLFQMSANDSASLVDSPKASALGLHRALFYNEQEGSLETFRPYALPPADWVDQAAALLRRSA